MILSLVAAVLLQAPPAGAEVRTLTASIVDDKGRPVLGLTRQDVAVLENGVAREVASVEPDTRPLALALLVDTSQEIATDYRLHVVDALDTFLQHLPEGARFTIWTTGDRPTKLTDLGNDVPAAVGALRRSFLSGGNTLLDALVEATRDLKKQEGSETAVVVVTGLTTNFGNRNRFTSASQARKSADLFLAVEYQEGSGDNDARTNYGFTLDTLTRETGGLFETPVSAMGVAPALERLSSFLRARYRIRYATLPEVKNRKVQVQVARSGVKALVAPPER
jgi:von Willebrand factor type A domain